MPDELIAYVNAFQELISESGVELVLNSEDYFLKPIQKYISPEDVSSYREKLLNIITHLAVERHWHLIRVPPVILENTTFYDLYTNWFKIILWKL